MLTRTIPEALLERDSLLQAIADRVRRSSTGDGSILVIEGPPGMGKSAILAKAAASAQADGFTVLSARGSELESEYGYGVVRQLFEATLQGADKQRRLRLLAGPASTSMAALSAYAGAPMAMPDAAFAVMNGLYWLTANLSDDGPVLLVVDDLQWADSASLGFLEFLGSRLSGLPVMVLAGAREELDAIGEFRMRPPVETVALSPLTGSGVKTLLEGALGPAEPGFLAAFTDVTRGNPFYVTELMRLLHKNEVAPTDANAERVLEVTPDRVGAAVINRIYLHGSEAMAMARALAVLGPHSPTELVAEMAGVELADATAKVRGLIESNVLDDVEPLSYSHPILASAVRDSIGAHALADAHLAAAKLLERRGADPERVAIHLAQRPATGDPWVAGGLAAAAGSAMGRGAPEEAIGYLERALAEPCPDHMRPVLLTHLGFAELAMQMPSGVMRLAEARDLMPPGPQRADVGLSLARFLSFAGMAEAAYAACAEARSDNPDRETGLWLDAVELMVLVNRGQHDDERLGSIASLKGETPAERAAMAILAFVRFKEGQGAQTIELIDRAVAAGGWAWDSPDGYSPIAAASVLFTSGRPSAAIRLATSLMEGAQRHGSSFTFSQYVGIRAVAHYHSGRLGDAVADAQAALVAMGPNGGLFRPMADFALINALLDGGDSAAAVAHAATCDYSQYQGDPSIAGYALSAHGRLKAELGEFAAARTLLTESAQIFESTGFANTAMAPARLFLAIVAHREGRSDEGRDMLMRSIAEARRFGAPWNVAQHLIALAEVDRDHDLDHLREAVAIVASTEARLVYARALVHLGAALRRHGHRREAVDILSDGLRVAEACGAGALVSMATRELAVAGAPNGGDGASARMVLTPSELRVAQAAASGATNREIAQSLFVTEKTVEAHLSSVFRKLGIRGRRGLRDGLK